MEWLIPSNCKIYNANGAFEKFGFIDWGQGNYKYEVGDTVYLYSTKPVQKITHKCIVECINLDANSIFDDYEFYLDKSKFSENQERLFIRIRLVSSIDNEALSLASLMENGLNSAPQGPSKLKDGLLTYISNIFNSLENHNLYPEQINENIYIEGATTTIIINKYERNPLARQKCIDIHGCYCHICGMNFEDIYGEIGKDFIHVHHIVAISEINKEYTVNPETDLIPVCPNCHAMAHRKVNGVYVSLDELRKIFAK